MIESLLEELPQHGGYDGQDPKRDPKADAAAENSFLASLRIVKRIVTRRQAARDPAQAADLVQEIACRIWRWRLNHQQKSEMMSEGEWNSFAARTAYNEVKRHFSRATRSESLPLESITEAAQTSIEKQTEIEVALLIQQVWQAICQLPLRQRQSLLLHSQDLIIYFLQIGITEKQLAEILDFSEKDWNLVCDRLPMADAEIAERTRGTAGSIKKARYEARVKLEGSIRK